MILSNTIKNGEEQAIALRSRIKEVIWKSKPTDTATFLKELNALWEKEHKKNTYYFVATSNLDIKSITQHEFDLEGMRIRLIDSGDAEKEFHYTDLFNEWQVFAETRINQFFHYTYVCIDIQASNPTEAHQIGFETFELFRGIINFADDYQTSGKVLYGGIPEPTTFSVMEPAQVQMIFDSEKKHIFDGFTIGFFDYQKKDFAKWNKKGRMDLLLDVIKTINTLEKKPTKGKVHNRFYEV